jgi:hypothetical protein
MDSSKPATDDTGQPISRRFQCPRHSRFNTRVSSATEISPLPSRSQFWKMSCQETMKWWNSLFRINDWWFRINCLSSDCWSEMGNDEALFGSIWMQVPSKAVLWVAFRGHLTCHWYHLRSHVDPQGKCRSSCSDSGGEQSALVGGWATPLKNMKVNGKDYPIYYGKKCSKPPTSISSWHAWNGHLTQVELRYNLHSFSSGKVFGKCSTISLHMSRKKNVDIFQLRQLQRVLQNVTARNKSLQGLSPIFRQIFPIAGFPAGNLRRL